MPAKRIPPAISITRSIGAPIGVYPLLLLGEEYQRNLPLSYCTSQLNCASAVFDFLLSEKHDSNIWFFHWLRVCALFKVSRAPGFSWTPNCDENELEITRRCV